MSKKLRLALVFLPLLMTGQSPRYGLGRTATDADVRARNISVSPTGEGLPEGRGNAVEGRPFYQAKCANCHGDSGQGTPGFSRLAGGIGTLNTPKPVLTVGSYWPYATTLWDYINRSMPYQSPGSLKAGEVYAITAFVLHLNGIVKESQDLDRQTLPRVQMPNRDGFISDPRPDVAPPHSHRDGPLRVRRTFGL